MRYQLERFKMLRFSVGAIIVLIIVFGAVPYRAASIVANRSPRSPPTTPESHISNFLHNHRTDSRADKPGEHLDNSTVVPLHQPQAHHPIHSTTTVPPVSQTELLVSLIHNTILTFRDQFPSLLALISSPKETPTTTTKHPRRVHHRRHKTHSSDSEHTAHERSVNTTSQEEVTESEEGSGDKNEEEEEEENFDEEAEIEPGTNAAPLIPPEILRTIVEASASSSARGAAGAVAGSIASLSAGASTGSSSGSGRSARQSEGESQGSGSGEFLIATIRTKANALFSLLFAPFISGSALLQRNAGPASGGSGLFPAENHHAHNDHHHSSDHGHHSSDHGHHQSSGHSDHHHSNEHHGDHHHHSDGHDQHKTQHSHHSEDHDGSHHQQEHQADQNMESSSPPDSLNTILGNDDERENLHRLSFRNAFTKFAKLNQTVSPDQILFRNGSVNYSVTNETLDGPLRVVFDNGGLDDEQYNETEIVRNSRKSRAILNESFGIYLLEILGSIAGLTWGAFNQIQIFFRGRSNDGENEFL